VRSLRTQITLVLVLGSLLAAGVVVLAVQLFSMERMSELLMLGVTDAAEADAMVQQYVGSVVAIGAVVGVLVGGLVAWWLARRVLRPLERLSEGTRRIAAGDLAARVELPPDAELADVAASFNQMAATLQRVEQL
jgi:HAMP domain-containing protein